MIGKIIQYEIDNHSDIIPVELLHECFSYSWQHWRHRKEKYIIKHGLIGCYILYNEKKEMIYIGKSAVSMRQRLASHLLDPPSEYLSDYEKEKILIKRDITKYFSFIEVDERMIDFVERGLINEYRPILNVQFVRN